MKTQFKVLIFTACFVPMFSLHAYIYELNIVNRSNNERIIENFQWDTSSNKSDNWLNLVIDIYTVDKINFPGGLNSLPRKFEFATLVENNFNVPNQNNVNDELLINQDQYSNMENIATFNVKQSSMAAYISGGIDGWSKNQLNEHFSNPENRTVYVTFLKCEDQCNVM